MTALTTFHPRTAAQFAARNILLQSSLRDVPLPFAIEDEYPLVLGAGGAQFSYCLADGENVVAHANLLPRVLVGGNFLCGIGLVGNVATAASYRGQGIMGKLLTELRQEAERLDLQALILWSDLVQFYQKQGFKSFGSERRYTYSRANLARFLGTAKSRVRQARDPLSAAEAAQILMTRPPVPSTLKREPAEFATLLAIPAMLTFLSQDSSQVDGYALVGKGYDMAGVVHEWGAPDPDHLLGTVAQALEASSYAEIMVLAPATLPRGWHEILSAAADATDDHHVGLAWVAPSSQNTVEAALKTCFIWGLDSI